MHTDHPGAIESMKTVPAELQGRYQAFYANSCSGMAEEMLTHYIVEEQTVTIVRTKVVYDEEIFDIKEVETEEELNCTYQEGVLFLEDGGELRFCGEYLYEPLREEALNDENYVNKTAETEFGKGLDARLFVHLNDWHKIEFFFRTDGAFMSYNPDSEETIFGYYEISESLVKAVAGMRSFSFLIGDEGILSGRVFVREEKWQALADELGMEE